MIIEPELLTIVVAALTGVAVMLILALIWFAHKLAKLKSDYEALAEFVHTLNNEFRDLSNAAMAVDERVIASELRVNAFNSQFGQLAEKINTIQHNEAASQHPYSQAIQKVHRGATVNELMQTSGLSQDEALLLIRLHGSKTP
jgi:hypothetical protein